MRWASDHALVVERQAQRGAGGQPRRPGARAARRRARGVRPGPTTQRRAENVRTSGTSVEMTRPAGGEQLAQRRAAAAGTCGRAGSPTTAVRRCARSPTTGSGVTTHSTPPGRSSPAQRSIAATGSSRCSITSASTTTSKPSRSTKASNGLLAHVEPQHLAGVARGRARELEPDRLVAAAARLVEQQAVPAADVEQAPAGDLGADEVEQAAGGRAAPGLLAEVGVVAACRDRARAARRRPAAAAAARCRTRRTSAGRRGGRSRGARGRRRRPPGHARWCRRCAG